jgi:murein DD-endopeptidase MepM/ murein hydrolase activator NlpD
MKNLTALGLALSLIILSGSRLYRRQFLSQVEPQPSTSALFLFNARPIGRDEDPSGQKPVQPAQSGETRDSADIIARIKSVRTAAAGNLSAESQPAEAAFNAIPQIPGEFPFVGIGEDYASFACILPADYLTDCYGTPRGPGNRDHRGYDYAMALGIESWPVYTPLGGLVTYSGQDPLLGNLLVVESGGYQWLLGHNAEIVVTPGQIVQAGDLVAYAGTSGDSTLPHAHSEFRRCWTESGMCIAVDPLDVWLPGQTSPCDWEAGQVISYTLYNGEELTCGAGIDSFRVEQSSEGALR